VIGFLIGGISAAVAAVFGVIKLLAWISDSIQPYEDEVDER
jgi:hypothetical protein